MLIGEYTHSLDSKHRLSLPAKFRKELGKKVVATRGLDNCLFMYTLGSWQQVVGKLNSLPVGSAQTRGIARFILAGAVELDIDTAGRVLFPEYLREFAALKHHVVITGVSDRLEIWDEKRWQEYKKALEGTAVEMAQILGEVGRF